ncbi:MAG TPA: Uma2 family endonuclease [Polyangiaceae bacterium]|nr:Uma2 family endonuclease [Polyangiaceae bacterium]
MLPAEKPGLPDGAPRRQPAALHFPVAAEVPETKRHLELRTLLYLVLRTMADEHAIGCDQFVYWDPTDPSRCLAPDAFVRLGVPDSIFTSWKTWERGVPDIAVGIASDSDASELAWDVKLRRYQELGVRELVRFDADEAPERQVRIWDRADGALVERQDGDHSCRGLKVYWVVVPLDRIPAALRLARDAEGCDLVLTPEEREARARKAAEQRVAELEAALRRRGG